jgi:hypothetical protein
LRHWKLISRDDFYCLDSIFWCDWFCKIVDFDTLAFPNV